MAENNRPGMGLEVNIRGDRKSKQESLTDPETPFCMAVLGDFSGRFNQSVENDKALAQRKFISIDRDNFEQVLAGFKLSFDISPTVQSDDNITINITGLDDFHPDVLYENLEVFSQLRSLRRRLKDNASFDAAASEIMGWLVDDNPEQSDHADQEVEVVGNMTPDALLDNILDSSPQSSGDLESLTSPGGIDRLVKQIVAPYVEPSANPRQQEMIDAVDEAIAGHMRQILHNPHFQAVEALWRSVYFLISRIETGSDLKIYLLDVSRHELDADLAADADSSAMHKLFCEPAINDTPWSLLVGNYTFEDTVDDVLLLSQLGRIAKKAHAVFLAGAKDTLAGCDSFSRFPDADDWQYRLKSGVANAWNILRQDPVADVIGLALPRFLLRLPYGEKTKPIDAFKFEEITGDNSVEGHQSLLWGNAAFIKAEQLARTFSENHWDFQPTSIAGQTEKLPMYYFVDEGESQSMPCAEIYLTEKGGNQISEQGLIPLWSVKNRDAVRSGSYNSLAADGKNLQGRWVK